MDYKTLSIKDVKKIVFEQQFKKFPYLNKFKENPYTYLKARYYMYCSVFLVYLFHFVLLFVSFSNHYCFLCSLFLP